MLRKELLGEQQLLDVLRALDERCRSIEKLIAKLADLSGKGATRPQRSGVGNNNPPAYCRALFEPQIFQGFDQLALGGRVGVYCFGGSTSGS